MTGVGDCVLQRVDDPEAPDGFRLRIIQADPRILITPQLLEEFRLQPRPDVTLADDVLTIRAENRTVVYRIGEYDRAHRAYHAEWPD